MAGARARTATLAWLLVGAAALLGSSASAAAAASPHRAAVIVDTGDEVHRMVVTFDEDSITGLQALERAGADPAVVGYAGEGGAVCGLYGVGHPADTSSCLGTGDDPRYWSYYRAPAGTTGFPPSTYSRGCACTARVHDGDVEGWRFGSGDPPPYASVADLVADDPPPASSEPSGVGDPPAASAETGVATTPDTATKARGAPRSTAPPSTTVAPAGGPGAPLAAGAAVTSTTRGTERSSRVAGRRVSASHPGTQSSDGSAASLAGFAAVLAVLVVGIFAARKARSRRASSRP